MIMDSSDVISQATAARRLGISRSRVGDLVRAGRLPPIEVGGRIFTSAAAVAEFLPRDPGRPKKILLT